MITILCVKHFASIVYHHSRIMQDINVPGVTIGQQFQSCDRITSLAPGNRPNKKFSSPYFTSHLYWEFYPHCGYNFCWRQLRILTCLAEFFSYAVMQYILLLFIARFFCESVSKPLKGRNKKTWRTLYIVVAITRNSNLLLY